VVGPRKDASIASVETFETLKDVDDAAITNILSIVLTCVKHPVLSLTADDKVELRGGLYWTSPVSLSFGVVHDQQVTSGTTGRCD
jgi:hypothetical protein